MSFLAVLEVLLLVNMLLFMGVFTLLAQPPTFIDAVLRRIRGEAEPDETSRERAEALLRKTLWVLGLIGCILLLAWSILTGFVITLYREGLFRGK